MLNARESKHGLPRNRHIYGNQLFKGLCKLVRSVAAGMSDSTDPLGYNLPGSSVLGILQARILELLAISASRGSSPPRDRTASPVLAGGCFSTESPGKPMYTNHLRYLLSFCSSNTLSSFLDLGGVLFRLFFLTGSVPPDLPMAASNSDPNLNASLSKEHLTATVFICYL